jgi:hypothetical protein
VFLLTVVMWIRLKVQIRSDRRAKSLAASGNPALPPSRTQGEPTFEGEATVGVAVIDTPDAVIA